MRSMMSCQPQSMVFGSTSHLPSAEPPHGPFSRLLEHRVTGHTPPKSAMTHVPQPEQRSDHTPCSRVVP